MNASKWFIIFYSSSNAPTGPLSSRDIQFANLRTSQEDDHDEAVWVMNLIAEGCGQELKTLTEKARSGLWIVGQEAVKFGLIKGFIESE